jgi:hypothetical protein
MRKLKSRDRGRKRTKQRRPTESIFTGKVRPRRIEVDGRVIGEERSIFYMWDWELVEIGNDRALR